MRYAKPPIGPKLALACGSRRERARELALAIDRYEDAHKLVPKKWEIELDRILRFGFEERSD